MSFQENAALLHSIAESAPVNIMCADRDGTVQYLNARSFTTLRTIEGILPVKVDDIVGGSIDVFHKIPAYQQDILKDDSKLPLNAEIKVGEHILDLLVTAMRDSGGNYVGPMVTWEIVTEKLQAANDVARLSSMTANAPVNIMCADRDGIVRYMNEKSVATLHSIEELLPVPVDDIVGGSIDVFHKNPAYQQGLLADINNLPINTEIQVGEHTLDLLVAPMLDVDGDYVGPMVTWEIVTEKLKAANDVARINSMIQGIPINIMCADMDGVVQFMNPASNRTLTSLQGILPVQVEDIVGGSIDVFHKCPPYQLDLIKDSSKMPISSQITVGTETLDLLISPMTNAEGDYIGPMVTWGVITQKLLQEQALSDATDREHAAAVTLKEKVDQILIAVQAAADGDLTQTTNISGEDSIGKMGEGLDRLITGLRGSISSIAGNATTLASASEELSSVAQEMSASSEKTSVQANVVSKASKEVNESIQTVAAGTEELTASIQEISNSAQTAADVARDAVKVAGETNTKISQLSDSSAEIGQVIKIITRIAQQTNLLALNATIEAARAGEAGKSFAVVANEVKELAKATAKATKDISSKILAIQTETQESVTAIEKISGIIGTIHDTQNSIASAVEEQATTTGDMSKNVQAANDSTMSIVSNIEGVAGAAGETSEGAAGVNTSAVELSTMAAVLETLVARFKF
jgi:methyl-accepting chemotaxis protein